MIANLLFFCVFVEYTNITDINNSVIMFFCIKLNSNKTTIKINIIIKNNNISKKYLFIHLSFGFSKWEIIFFSLRN